MKKFKVVHLLNTYPGANTTGWLYSLMKHTPECNVVIAPDYYTKHNFYDKEFTYIDNPVSGIIKHKKSLGKTNTKIIRKSIFYLVEKILLPFKKYLFEEIVKNNPDIIHAHFGDVGCKYADLVGKLKLPFVVSFYGYDYEYLPFIIPSYKEKYRQLFKRADKIICEGTFASSILKKIGCPENKIEIVKLGIEVEKINFPEKFKKENHLRLIQIATFREKKGHIYSLKAFHKMLDVCPNMELTLIGIKDNNIDVELGSYIKSNNLTEKVKIIYEIDYKNLHGFLSDYDVFIHPSCYAVNKDCEGGAPIVLLDAHACGLPVISTTHCDIPSEVIHGVTGLLTPEKDIDSLSNSIKYFYEMNDDRYKTFSKAARKHIEDNYSIKKNALLLRKVYDSLIN